MDIYTGYLPIFNIARCFGVSPFALVGDVGTRRLVVTWPTSLPGVAVFAVLLGIYIETIKDLVATLDRIEEVLTIQAVVSYSQLSLDVLLVLLVVAMARVNAVEFAALVNKLDDVDVALKTINIDLPYLHSRRFSTTLIVLSSMMFAVNYVILFYALATGHNSVNYSLILYWLMYQIPKLISYTFISYLMTTLLLLRQRFAVIRERLAMFVNMSSSLIMDGEVEPRRLQFLPLLSSLRRLRRLHEVLCDATGRMNAMYSLQILVFATSVFLNVTTELNYIIIQLTMGRMTGQDVAHSIVLLMTVVLQIVFITATCAITSAEANSVAIFVHKLLVRTQDPACRTELRLFSQQLLHRKAEFKAFGFFPLDGSLLYSIVGGVTTYLVILVQFQLSAQQ